MRAHYLQHVPFEGLGSIQNWLESNTYEISCTRFFQSSDLPDPSQIDLLIIMGGPMSVNDEKEFNWLTIEKQFINQVIKLGKPVLGICLGAQLIASSLGSKIYRNPVKEIGWFPVQASNPIQNPSPIAFSQPTPVFHWHAETFDLPKGARRIASSEACRNQAFVYQNNVIGLQFHLETTPASAQLIVENCKSDLNKNRLIKSEYIQNEDDILSTDLINYSTINSLMDDILSHITQPD